MDFNFYQVNHFKDQYKFDHILDLDKNDFILFHCDEKWELENYSKLFSGAKKFTDINIKINSLRDFLLNLSAKKTMKIVITTGYIDTNIIFALKNISKQIENTFYEVQKDIYLITNQNFNSISHLISKCKLFISCHGAFTHIASSYNIKIIDVIEKDKKHHYFRITSHMKNYISIHRSNFEELNKNIIVHS